MAMTFRPLVFLFTVFLIQKSLASPTVRDDIDQEDANLISSPALKQDDPKIRYCLLGSKIEDVGKDRLGNRISVNVGRCRKHIRRDNPSAYNKENADATCDRHAVCVPATEALSHYYPVSGHREVSVITSCGCGPRNCQRISKNVTFYPDTPFQKVVDVGICHGKCGTRFQDGGKSCKATQTRKTYFDGPHGSEGVEVIEACTCVSSCYRIARFDVVPSNDGAFQVLDMGECVGGCSNRRVLTCLLRSKKLPDGSCFGPSLYQNVTMACRPSSYNPVSTVHSSSGYAEALQVKECACQEAA